MLSYKKKEKSIRIPLVTHYHPRLRFLSKILRKYYYLLEANEYLKKVFPEPPMVAFRKLKNIRDHLVHTTVKKEKHDILKCNQVRCKTCDHLQETKTVTINGKIHKINNGGSCITKNTIYALECMKYNKFYIGETGDELRSRINGHRALTKRVKDGAILDEKFNDTGAAAHFGQTNHNFEKNMKLYILENNKWGFAYERKQKEGY